MKSSTKIWVTLVLSLVISSVFIHAEEYHMKDGSILYGTFVSEDETSITIENDILGKTKIPLKDLKYEGRNYNNGFMFYYSELNEDKSKTFGRGPMFSISSAGVYDEKISTCFDLSYFTRSFECDTLKYLHIKTDSPSEPDGGIVRSNYENNAHFLMPALIFRLNILPNVLQDFFNKINLFPYIGIGGGYGLGILNYTRIDTTSFDIDNFNYSNKDIKYNTHLYGGFHYQFLCGISYKFSSKATLVLEFNSRVAKFEKFLSDDEKSAGLKAEVFELSGVSPSFGIRFGTF